MGWSYPEYAFYFVYALATFEFSLLPNPPFSPLGAQLCKLCNCANYAIAQIMQLWKLCNWCSAVVSSPVWIRFLSWSLPCWNMELNDWVLFFSIHHENVLLAMLMDQSSPANRQKAYELIKKIRESPKPETFDVPRYVPDIDYKCVRPFHPPISTNGRNWPRQTPFQIFWKQMVHCLSPHLPSVYLCKSLRIKPKRVIAWPSPKCPATVSQ